MCVKVCYVILIDILGILCVICKQVFHVCVCTY